MSVNQYALAMGDDHFQSQEQFKDLDIPAFKPAFLKTRKHLSIFTDLRTSDEVFNQILKSKSKFELDYIIVVETESTSGLTAFHRRMAQSFKSLLSKVVHVTDEAMLFRLLHAIKIGAESDLILDAVINNDQLTVTGCDCETYSGPISDIPPLKSISKAQLEFSIDQHGSYLHFPTKDIHLDLHTLRYIWDEGFRKQEAVKTMKRLRNWGERMTNFRKLHKLNQSDFDGLSDKQIRRFESGEQIPTLSALRKISKAYSMNVEDFISALGSI